MAISFSCTCGASFDVPDELAGLRARCPACGTTLIVPTPADDEPITDVEVEETTTPYRLADESRPFVDVDDEVVDDVEGDEEIEFVDDDVEFIEEAEADEGVEPDAEPVFFVAAYPPGTSLRPPKTFRIYQSGRELLVLHAGPFGWGLVDTLNDRPGIRDDKARRRDTGLGGGVLGSDADEVFRRKLALRAAVLDRMTLAELRAEAESDKFSFKVTSDNTPNARIEPPRPGMFEEAHADDLVVGRLKFTHATAGKWELVLLSQADAKMAMGALRRVLGYENVEVTLKLKEGRG
jgi:hypothetical protein